MKVKTFTPQKESNRTTSKTIIHQPQKRHMQSVPFRSTRADEMHFVPTVH